MAGLYWLQRDGVVQLAEVRGSDQHDQSSGAREQLARAHPGTSFVPVLEAKDAWWHHAKPFNSS